ncbi:PREDICTED: nucleosome assembly protein 1-like 1-B [Nicrophorus vespilloides]|uniref:Nucleosome assembly protein 1-like 1-B n=1 Tax=Nicrophorus vespilloides TaxID=110193 RepID=A0ABM1NHA8_NICVS|nr:PREDICTED: nucleosome assembly protein 1-like 1-B [Nicrophorus vespilloides]XP_017786209.1 PREDICTED: nucleosome assembly protein 1-like 1-B [Nicrophorus vespilloides]
MATENEHVGDCPEDLEYAEEEDSKDIMKFQRVLDALQKPAIEEMMAALPAPVKRRIKALKKLQLEQINIEAKFFEEVHALECKYHKMYAPLYEKRHTVISGEYEPKDDECDWVSDEEEEITKDLEEKANLAETPKVEEDVKGIPDFWLTIFRNVDLLSEMVQEHDEPILKYLTDIKTKFIESPMGFVLEFYFAPNEYFTDSVLIKEYDMKCLPEADDPFGFEGPEIFKCKGCTINWNKGMNVTVKTMKKKQKHKSRGVVRVITKTVRNDSFFNFFEPPVIPEDVNEDDVDEELRLILTTDFEIGHYIRERIVPRAVLYFTGEDIENEEDDYNEDGEEMEEEDDDDNEDCNEIAKNAKDNCKQQ